MKLADQPSFRLIAPFLGAVMDLLEDDSVTEVMINPDAVFVERGGRLEAVRGCAWSPCKSGGRRLRSPGVSATTSARSGPCWMPGCRTARA